MRRVTFSELGTLALLESRNLLFVPFLNLVCLILEAGTLELERLRPGFVGLAGELGESGHFVLLGELEILGLGLAQTRKLVLVSLLRLLTVPSLDLQVLPRSLDLDGELLEHLFFRFEGRSKFVFQLRALGIVLLFKR